jgi:hypothetical protein
LTKNEEHWNWGDDRYKWLALPGDRHQSGKLLKDLQDWIQIKANISAIA